MGRDGDDHRLCQSAILPVPADGRGHDLCLFCCSLGTVGHRVVGVQIYEYFANFYPILALSVRKYTTLRQREYKHYLVVKTYIYSRHWLRKTVGVALIVFGILGLILPILPGFVPLAIGLELVGVRLAFFDRFFTREVKMLDLPEEIVQSAA